VLQGWAGTPSNYSTLAPSSTLDLMLGSRLNGKKALILADVEGCEQLMLDGATSLLANEPKPIWMVEIVADWAHAPQRRPNDHFTTTFDTFFHNGYQAFSIDKHLRQVTADEIDSMALGNVKSDSHNFLFLASS
jgi:hypothetical protein